MLQYLILAAIDVNFGLKDIITIGIILVIVFMVYSGFKQNSLTHSRRQGDNKNSNSSSSSSQASKSEEKKEG